MILLPFNVFHLISISFTSRAQLINNQYSDIRLLFKKSLEMTQFNKLWNYSVKEPSEEEWRMDN